MRVDTCLDGFFNKIRHALFDDIGQVKPPPRWTGPELGCAGCHGNPPTTGQHTMHVIGMGWWCADCHAASVDFDNKIGASHLNGRRDVNFYSPGTSWDGGSCSSACHADTNWYSWR